MFRTSWSITNSFTWISQTFSLTETFELKKITTDLHILAQVNIQFPDDMYAKLKTYISEI